MPIFDASNIDTAPGTGGPMSPSDGFEGSDDDYLVWLRDRFTTDPFVAQAMFVASRFQMTTGKTVCVGPYADALRLAIKRFGGR